MADNFDFLADLSPEDQVMLKAKNAAKARQEAAWAGGKAPHPEKEADEAREATARQMAAAIQAGEEAVKLAGGPVPSSAEIPQAAPRIISVWTVDGAMDKMLAPTWKQLKEDLKAQDGTWKVLHFDLDVTFDGIVGFFRPSTKIKFPDLSLKENFEVIVKDGTVFRSDSD